MKEISSRPSRFLAATLNYLDTVILKTGGRGGKEKLPTARRRSSPPTVPSSSPKQVWLLPRASYD